MQHLKSTSFFYFLINLFDKSKKSFITILCLQHYLKINIQQKSTIKLKQNT